MVARERISMREREKKVNMIIRKRTRKGDKGKGGKIYLKNKKKR